MSIATILEVGIGLIFVYLLLGLVVSALQEVIAALLGLRSKYLMEGLSTILREARDDCWLARRHILPWSNKLDEGSDLFKAVASHALVNGITPSTLPSYVPAGNFATALIETLRGGATGSVASEVEKAINGLTDGPAKQALSALFVDAKGDLDAFKKSVETWFDGAMDRVSGVYKRWTQYFALLAGLAIAIALNANSIVIAERLLNDNGLREAAVGAATAFVQHCLQEPRPDDCPAPTPPQDETDATAPDTQESASATPETVAEKYENAEAVYAEVSDRLKALGYPIGWSNQDWSPFDKWDRNKWIAAIFGWLVTGLAVSLGAPFWFDMLKTFLNIRGAGGKPKPSGTPQGQPTS